MHVIFVVGVVVGVAACYYRSPPSGCNRFMSFSSSAYVMACYCRRRRRRRHQHVIIVANAPSDGCHCRRPSQTTPDRASCTEFTQNKIHHADDDDDARHQAAQHNHHRPIAGRAPRRPCSDRSGCCGRTATSSKCRRRDSIYYCCPGVNGSFFRVPSLSRRCIYRHGILRAVNACCWRTRQ